MKSVAITSPQRPGADVSKSDLDALLKVAVQNLVGATNVKQAKAALEKSASDILATPNNNLPRAVRVQSHKFADTLNRAAEGLHKIDHELFSIFFKAAAAGNYQVVGVEADALKQLADWVVGNASAPGAEAVEIRNILRGGRKEAPRWFTGQADDVLDKADRALGTQISNMYPTADLKSVDTTSAFARDILALFDLFNPDRPEVFHYDWDRLAEQAVDRELGCFQSSGGAAGAVLLKQANTRAKALSTFARAQYRDQDVGPGEYTFMDAFQEVVDAKLKSLKPGKHDTF